MTKELPIKSVRARRWSLAQWKPRVEGKKTRVRLQYGTKDTRDPTGFSHQAINFWENDVDDLIKAINDWKTKQ